MAYSTQRAVSNGTLGQLALALDYFDRSEITVYYNGVLAGASTWSWVGTTDKTIQFTPTVPNGVEVLVQRTTQLAAPLHQYTLGAQFIAETLDENFQQVLRIAQEAREGSGAVDVYNDVDHHGYRIKNLGTAVDPADAVSLGQYQADAAGAATAKTAAQTAATNAATSETNALASKDAAATSAANAATSETNALASKNAAATSATNAATSESNALASKNAAATSATNAATSESNALASKNAAASSAASVVRNGSGGVAGLTGFVIDLFNAAGTIKSALASAATAARTWTFPDKDGTIVLLDDVPRANALTNGGFQIWQRGAGPFTAPGYTADMWSSSGDAPITTSRQPVALADAALLPARTRFFARLAVTATTTVSGLGRYLARMEGSETFSGQTITVSFYAKADAIKSIGYELEQVWTNTTLAANVSGIGAGKVSIDTTWKRYSFTIQVPSANGKEPTPGGGYLQLSLWFDSGSNWDARNGALGHQSGTFDIACAKIEEGVAATPFEQRPLAQELQLCQRFYATVNSPVAFSGNVTSGSTYYATFSLPVTMRVSPTLSGTSQNGLAFPNAVGSLGVGDSRTVYESRVANTTTSAGVFGSSIVASAEFN